MAVATRAREPATIDDLIARVDRDRLEIIAGEIVDKSAPSPNHSYSEIKLGAVVDPFNRRAGGSGPGGWWIFSEIHVAYAAGELYCHDLAGWRRDRVPARPTEWPVQIRPDWVCEIVSPKHEKHDLVTKPRVLHVAEVPYSGWSIPRRRSCWCTAGHGMATRWSSARTRERRSTRNPSRRSRSVWASCSVTTRTDWRRAAAC